MEMGVIQMGRTGGEMEGDTQIWEEMLGRPATSSYFWVLQAPSSSFRVLQVTLTPPLFSSYLSEPNPDCKLGHNKHNSHPHPHPMRGLLVPCADYLPSVTPDDDDDDDDNLAPPTEK